MTLPLNLEGPRVAVTTVRVFLWIVFAIAVAAGVLSVTFGTAQIVGQVRAGETSLVLVAEHPLPAAAHGGTATILEGHFGSADVTLTHVSPFLMALSTTSSVGWVLTQGALAFVVAMLALRILRGGAFRRILSLGIALAGAVLLIGGLVTQAANTVADGQAALELTGGNTVDFWPLAGRFDPTVMVIGVILLLVGLVFEFGERLQRETEGLV